MSKNPKNVQHELTKEDMQTYVQYLMTGQVNDETHAKQLKRLSNRSVNLADVATLVMFLNKKNDGYISSIIEEHAIMAKILTKLGATDDIKREARAEYEDELKAYQDQIKVIQEDMNKQAVPKEGKQAIPNGEE